MTKPQEPPLAALRRKARHYTVQALYQWQMTQAPVNKIETEFRVDNDMRNVDLEYFHEVLHAVPAECSELDGVFTPFLDRERDELGPVELAILRMATYELKQRIDVPFKVVINEAVSLTKKFGATDSHKYINGVLDKVAQQLRELEVKAESK